MITHPLRERRTCDVSPAPLPCSPLKYQRLLRGWSQQDVADELYKRCAAEGNADVGIHAKLVGRWERGETKPSPIYRKHLCTLYGLTAAQLGLLDGLIEQMQRGPGGGSV
jgi:transcriptional regulator with XRE-family HTH domain